MNGVKPKSGPVVLPSQPESVAPKPAELPAAVEVSKGWAPRSETLRASDAASVIYEAMKGGLIGAGTDEAAIFRALENKSPAQIGAIRSAYADHYRRDLDHDLKRELSGHELLRAQKLLRSDARGAAVEALFDKKTAVEALQGKSPDERAAMAQAFTAQTGKKLETRLEPVALATLQGDAVGADVAALNKAMDGLGTDVPGVFGALEGRSPEHMGQLKAAFAKTGRSLEGALGAELSGSDLARARVLLDGDSPATRAKVGAIDLREALTGFTDRAKLEKVLTGKSDAERKAIAAEYQTLTGSPLAGALVSLGALHGNFREKASLLLAHGRLTDVETLHFATSGFGTDEAAIAGVLEGKTKPQIAQLSTDYRAKYGRDLSTDLSGDLSGREAFDVGQQLKGVPGSAAEALQRANEGRAYERGGLANALSRQLMDKVSSKGGRLDANVQRANDFYKTSIAQNEALGLPKALTEKQETRLAELLGFTAQDIASYRVAKDTAADVAANGATTLAAVGVSLATVGTATPLAVAGMAAVAGAGARVATKSAIAGKGYGVEAFAADGMIGAVDGATAGIAGPARGASVTRQIIGSANAGGVGNAVGTVARALPKDETYTPEGLKNLAGRTALSYGHGAATGGAMNAGMRVVSSVQVAQALKKIDAAEASLSPQVAAAMRAHVSAGGKLDAAFVESAAPGLRAQLGVSEADVRSMLTAGLTALNR